ncbi:MAG: DUF1640 domain-containing protein, partial [Magnetococcales bacterium]|nr:DUF1640 domain-containing protein [Magnetococcales bacterium]
KLREAGVNEQQAEVQAEALVDLVEDRLATKRDVADLKRDIESIRAELKRDIKEMDGKIESVRADLKRDIKELDGKIETTKIEILARMDTKMESAKVATIQWTAGMFAAQTALIIGALFAMLKINQHPLPQPIGYPTPPVQELRVPAPQAQPPVSR